MELAMTLAVMAAVSAALGLSGCAEPLPLDSGLEPSLTDGEGPPGLSGTWVPLRGLPRLDAGLGLDADGGCRMVLSAPEGDELLGTCAWSASDEGLTLRFDEGVGRGAGQHHARLDEGRLVFAPAEGGCDLRAGLLVASPWVRAS